MGFRKNLATLLTVALTAGVVSCGSPSGSEEESIEGQTNFAHVLTSDEKKDLESYDPVEGTLVFDDGVDFEKGDIIVSGTIKDKAPNGFLRKVTSRRNGGEIIETSQATLEDALEEAEIHYNGKLRNNSSNRLFHPQVSIINEPFETVLYDHDDNFDTTHDQIVFRGNVEVDVDIDFDVKIKRWKLKELGFTSTFEETANFEISSAEDRFEINERKKIVEYSLPPINILVPTVPPFPFVLKPKIVVSAGFEGVAENLSANLIQTGSLIAGFEYDGSWSPISELDIGFEFDAPVLNTNLKAKGSVGPQLDMLAYGVAGVYGGVNGYVRVDAKLPSVKVIAGLEGTVGVKMEVFSRTIAEYGPKPIINFETDPFTYDFSDLFGDDDDDDNGCIVTGCDWGYFCNTAGFCQINSSGDDDDDTPTPVCGVTFFCPSDYECGSANNCVEIPEVDELIWQMPHNPNVINWNEAVDYCSNLNLDGSSSWRLPTISELRTLVEDCSYTETDGSCAVTDDCLSEDSCFSNYSCGNACINSPTYCFWDSSHGTDCSHYFWSSSSNTDDLLTAWIVDFDDSIIHKLQKSWGEGIAKCVRDNDSSTTIDCVDNDGDGYGVGEDCLDWDCNDNNINNYQVFPGYVDIDRDGYGSQQSMNYCTGTELPDGASENNLDCDDNDPYVWDNCSTGDCVDEDGDGYGEGVDCLGSDCNDSNSDAWRILGGHVDVDGDGYGAGFSILEEICSGDFLPYGYSENAEDCNDENSSIHDGCSYLNNGKIVFVSERDGNPEIYVANSDGSGQTRLTYDSSKDISPLCSPDGNKIAFVSDRSGDYQIRVMDIDGANGFRISDNYEDNSNMSLAWSPDSKKIAYMEIGSNSSDLYITNIDWHIKELLTNNLSGSYSYDFVPMWSPFGDQIFFTRIQEEPWYSDIYSIDTDSSNLAKLTNNAGDSDRIDLAVALSRYGDKILLASNREHLCSDCFGMYIMNSNGTNENKLVDIFDISDSSFSKLWSKYTNHIVFQSPEGLEIINPDGSNRTMILDGLYVDNAEWSPDEENIIFTERVDGYDQIQIVDYDKTITPLTSYFEDNYSADWCRE
jgi:Tol biopolymer transport system component